MERTEQTENEVGTVAPYLAYKTFLTALDTLNQGLPPRIDRSMWRTHSGRTQADILKAFQFFGFIDADGNVQPILKELVDAKDNRLPVLKRIFEERYSKIVQLGRDNASAADLDVAMRDHGVQGETLRKSVTFFTQAAADTGITVSPHWPGGRKTTGTGATRRRSTGARRPRRQQEDHETPATPPATPPPSGQNVNVHPMLAGAIQWLFENGKGWTAEQADAWGASFLSNVHLVYPPSGTRRSVPQRRSEPPKPSVADNDSSGDLAGQNEAVEA